jgi:hypothetical protein
MYQAELHGKLSRTVEEAEDILTSNVFSFYLYSDRKHLQHLLKSVELDVTLQEAANAAFSFWPTLPDNTEPDLVIEVGRYYVLAEAKLHAGYGKDVEHYERHQLLRELRGGRHEAQSDGKEFILLTVTDEPIPHESVYGVLKGTGRQSWRWTNWSRIARLLETGPAVGRMGEDLLALLCRRGLRRFDGFRCEKEHLEKLEGRFFFDSTTTRSGRFTGFACLPGCSLLTEISRPLFTVAGSGATLRRKPTHDPDGETA